MVFLEWLQATALATVVAESLWAYPLFETLHSIGMAMLVGALGLIDLRVLGYKPQLPILATQELLPLAWLGFTINLISGMALFISDAVYFFNSYTFRVKILLIVLGGANAFLLGRAVFPQAQIAGGGFTTTAGVKWVAASSLVFWMGAIVAGRLIAYAP